MSRTVTDLRKDLVETLKLFPAPWDFSDLEEWMGANGYEKPDVHNVGKLKEIIGKLEDSAANTPPAKKKETIDMETGEIETKEDAF